MQRCSYLGFHNSYCLNTLGISSGLTLLMGGSDRLNILRVFCCVWFLFIIFIFFSTLWLCFVIKLWEEWGCGRKVKLSNGH